ncbi:hypothetical protein [Nitrosomonas mobilis]|uniref:hypothetical protein n=1 Tax=Nitrosomonas mobilis TaxID=51642 RepID=UPI0015A1B817|nr:hypothetical protein [Nitrosomonas mobilis]
MLEDKLDQLLKLHQAIREENARLRDLLTAEQAARRQLQNRIDLTAERLQKLLDNLPEC